MKFNPVPVLAVLLLLSSAALGQQDESFKLLLQNGTVIPGKNITADKINEFNQKATRTNGKSFLIIQFEKIPTEAERKQLSQGGIELLDYVPHNAYTVTVAGSLNNSLLQQVKARAIVTLTPEQKMQPALAAGIYPSWAIKVGGTIDVLISFPKTFSFEEVSKELKQRNIDIIASDFSAYRIIGVRVAMSRMSELAAMSCVEFVQPMPSADKPLNNNSRADSRATILNSSLPGGRNLKGQGMIIGVGDNTDPQSHIDFTNRLIDRSSGLFYVTPPPENSRHGSHVTGTLAGGGIANELYTGYAPKARVITQNMSGILKYAATYVKDDSMMITNNSYGNIEGDCFYNGLYDLLSRVVDQQAFDLPRLSNVFAAGNSGNLTCSPYPIKFHTVLGSYQSSKNALIVGNTSNDATIFSSSSRGPVNDGRIKPEICALGAAVVSCVGPTATGYDFAWGTSMSSPGVAGGLTLLYQRYKQLSVNNSNPESGLMKALICNGGTDLGKPGPDYTFGFGWMNLLRSIDMLENNHYIISSIANSGNNIHTITVPANMAQLKVMLYWQDPPATILASHTLVNDLDLEVRNASNILSLPYILDTIPAKVDSSAIPGVDHINNIEQVVVTNPAAGPYTVTIKGTSVTQNSPQQYFIVYDPVPVQTIMTFPAGGEKFLPGEAITLQWDSYGDPANTFTIQYSTNNGSSWTDINTSVAANLRQLSWTVPNVNTEQAMIKISRNGTGLTSSSQAFTIIGSPAISLAATQCESYIGLQWSAVTGATDYEVMMLRGDEMVSMGTTAATSFNIGGLSKDTLYWVSVRARVNGNSGRRAVAISRQPNNGTCSGSISDNDLKIDSLLAPKSGRLHTSSELSATTTISVRIKNLDDAAINTFDMKYSVNGGAFSAAESDGPVAAGGTITHNFTSTYDFSAVGSYILKIAVQNTSAADPVAANDTMIVVIKQLPNDTITLTNVAGFVDDLEAADDSTYYNGQIGLSGADRYDFNSSAVYGRVRPFINSGIAYSGDKALTLDAYVFNGAGTADSLKATFNLYPHFNTTDDIRLDFRYKNHGQGPDNANKVWIRGDDQKPWIEVYDLYDNQPDPGSFKKSTSIELSDILTANLQDFSSSFQVRFGQFGHHLAADNDGGAGYTFDDIHLYKVDNDIQAVKLDTPILVNCALNNKVPIRVIVRNSADTTVNIIPITYTIDNGSGVADIIASIAGNTNIPFTFSDSADLSSPGIHIIKVWVAYPGDSFRDNDTITISIRNSPTITSYPYLENFEAGDGYWYTTGKNNSWEYGTPSSGKVKRAASGSKAWKTNLTGSYKDQQLSYLYSPCFDITGMTNPTLSLSISLDLEDCGTDLCDGAYMEYTADGVTWTRLGASGQGTNWYNKNYSGNNLWSKQDYTRWHVATIPLPAGPGFNRLRLRFVVTSDPFVNREGIAVDDIHIYDNIYGIYDGPPYTSNTINQSSVSGTNWIDFTDGGKLIASVNPNGRVLGSTDARAYIYTGAVRTNGGQYYHNRNITIKPVNRTDANDSATVRFYFLDTETETLISATGCPGCTKPSMAYELGVSKYSDADTSKENGTLADDNSADWLFINSARTLKVPFDKGYYAEFRVKDFSEFWLNNGGLNNNQSLPVELISFNARKITNNNVLVEWKTGSELNTDHFEIEIAKGNDEFQRNHFIKIGQLSSNGNSTTEQQYSFTDIENNKSGVRYYRLRIVDRDGQFSYSAVRPVVFDEEIKWQVYPNPSKGLFNLVYQAGQGENINIKLYDINGKLIHQNGIMANGFVQKHAIDLQPAKFAAGLYLLEVMTGGDKQLFRLVKQ